MVASDSLYLSLVLPFCLALSHTHLLPIPYRESVSAVSAQHGQASAVVGEGEGRDVTLQHWVIHPQRALNIYEDQISELDS